MHHVHPLLSPHQHGFIPGRSCGSNLACFLSNGYEAISESAQLDAVYTDFSSAFQSVNHRLLLYKLEHMYGVGGLALRWLTSYLGRRKQRVVLNGKVSDWVPAVSGTPEGGLLSPLLFSLFVNDLPSVVKTRCLMFADDVKIFQKVKGPNDVKMLQDDIDAVTRWAADWRLKLNPSKCKTFKITLKRNFFPSVYRINGNALEDMSSIRDLGVVLDRKLTFSDQINVIVSKANRALGLLIRSLQTASPRCRMERKAVLAAYNANVRAILEYCSIVWAGAAKCHLMRLERVQHKFLIWLANRTNAQHDSLDYGDLLRAFGLKSLHARRTENDIVFLCKIFKGFVSSSCLLGSFSLHVPMRTTRSATSTLFHVPRGRVSCVANGMFVRCPRVVNNFLEAQPQVDFLCDSLGKIKKRVALFTEPMRL